MWSLVSRDRSGPRGVGVEEPSRPLDVVLALLRRDSPGVPPGRLADAVWDAVALEAIGQGVAPLLYDRLRSGGTLRTVPRDAAAALEGAYLHNVLRNRAIYRQLGELLCRLGEAGIRVLVLKGAYLAERVYGDRTLRPMGDIDLLVPAANVGAAGRVLTACGYQAMPGRGRVDYTQHHHGRPFWRRGAVPVEIHWTITPPATKLAVDVDALWRRAVLAEVAGARVHALSPNDLILHLCLHASFNHRFETSILPLIDVDLTVDRYRGRVDWAALAAVANADGRSRYVHCTLAVARQVVGADVPGGALALFDDAAPPAVATAVAGYLGTAQHRLPAGFEHVALQKGAACRLGAIVRIVFPPPQEMRRITGSSHGRLGLGICYALRPIQLLVRHGTLVIRLLFSAVLPAAALRASVARQGCRRVVHEWLDRDCRTDNSARTATRTTPCARDP
jgi:hypothetical protein